MREQPVFSVDRTFSLVACVWVPSLLPLVDDSDTAPFAVQTVGGLTVCQICLLIQTLSLSTLVTCNTYLFSSITQNPVIQTHSLFFFHLLTLTAEWSVLRRGTFICVQASRPQMLWIVCSCDPLLYVCTFPVACGWGYYGNRIRKKKEGLFMLLHSRRPWALCFWLSVNLSVPFLSQKQLVGIYSDLAQMSTWTRGWTRLWWSKVKVTVTSRNTFLAITQEFTH